MTRAFRSFLTTAILPRQQAPGQRTPNQDAKALVQCNGNEFVLCVSSLQRIVNLLADEARIVPTIGNRQRLHQMPSRIVGAANVTHFSGADEGIKGLQRFFERRFSIPFMNLVQIDVIRPEPPQTVLALFDDVMTRGAAIVRSITHDHPELRGNQYLITATFQNLTKNLSRQRST